MNYLLNSPFLREIKVSSSDHHSSNTYPFNIAAIRNLQSLTFHPKVTYIVGENGMGKSTLLEAIAIASGFNPEGGTRNFQFATKETHSSLYEHIRLVRGGAKPRDGFFFRAESYYNVASYIDTLDEEKDSYGPPIKNSYGGKSLHEQSHGESFFSAFLNRFGGHGLYILDEPEAALSPIRQMSMLARIHELVKSHSQLIISTHSPILMAYPDSVIYQLTDQGIDSVKLEETDHYVVMKQFMNHKESMLSELFHEE